MRHRDPDHWLHKFTPREWMRAATAELSRAKAAFATGQRRAGLAGCRRAAGMAFNGALAAADEPLDHYGRSFMDHLVALQDDSEAPSEVREAARRLVQSPMPGGPLVALRTRDADEQLLEAACTVMAHALALIIRNDVEDGGDNTDPTPDH